MTSHAIIPELYRRRPRNHFVRLSVASLLVVILVSWLSGNFITPDTFDERRRDNSARFIEELKPFPLQHQDFDPAVALTWAIDLMHDKGWQALTNTLTISVAAIVLAGVFAALLALPAARNISTPDPFNRNPQASTGVLRLGWYLTVTCTRLLLIFLRAIPEYVWAFLLLSLLGPGAWPAVLALALHNTGILAKLSAEVIEDLPTAPLRSLTGLGASRLQLAHSAILPLALPRLLLFFFYRWETCVREATVLGMLGVVSLGYWIQDARARNFYDEMFFLVMLGAVLVMLGDVISSLTRAYVRRAS